MTNKVTRYQWKVFSSSDNGQSIEFSPMSKPLDVFHYWFLLPDELGGMALAGEVFS